MYFRKHFLEQVLKGLVLGALVELADKMAARLEGIAGERKGGFAEVLGFCQPVSR